MQDFSGEEGLDPRIRRTRAVAADALFSLLQEKNFEAIAIQDIAERSTINRATFYDHYRDKSELVEDSISQRFNDLLLKRKVVYDGTCVSGDTAADPDRLRFSDGSAQWFPKHQRLFEPFVQAAISGVSNKSFWRA